MNLLTVKEVAERLKSSERYVLDELRRKNLIGVRLGVGWRVAETDLDQYIEAHKTVRSVRQPGRIPGQTDRSYSHGQRRTVPRKSPE